MRAQDKAAAVEERLIEFSVRVIKLVDALPSTLAGRHIGQQLLRSGTSPAPNYAEARGAESRADFIHKLKIGLKELNESTVWIRVLMRAQLIRSDLLAPLLDENVQLCRILNASITTTHAGKDKHSGNDK
jgi:four helix bundle protein